MTCPDMLPVPVIDRVTLDDLKWAGGFLDGDGSVAIYSKRLRVSIVQAEKGWSGLVRMIQLFGGHTCKGYYRGEKEQYHREWYLRAEDALMFCRHMAKYTVIKRREFEAAARFTAGRTPFILTRGLERVEVKNMNALTKIVGLKRCQLWRNFKAQEGACTGDNTARDSRASTIVINGWTIQRVQKDTVDAMRKQLAAELVHFKKTAHEAVTEELSMAYVAGFIDSDGCIMLQKAKPLLSASQKHRAIIDQLQRQFGGRIRQNQQTQVYHINFEAHSKKMLELIQPYLVGKAPQGRLALRANKENWKAMKDKLMSMHGGGVQSKKRLQEGKEIRKKEEESIKRCKEG